MNFITYFLNSVGTKMRSAFFWVTTQLIVVIPCRRFVTTYRFNLRLKSWLKNSTNTSVSNQHHTPQNNPEERISHLLRGDAWNTFCRLLSTTFCAVCSVLSAFAKLRKEIISLVKSFCPSVRPHGTQLPLNRDSWNLILHYFSIICWEN